MISNGDLSPEYIDAATGLPAPKPYTPQDDADVARRKITYFNHKKSLPPSLFFLAVGTWTAFRRMLEYPDGTTIAIEILHLPEWAEDVEGRHVITALNALHESILWMHLFTGPDQFEYTSQRDRIVELIREREEIKASEAPLINIKANQLPVLQRSKSSEMSAKPFIPVAVGLSPEQKSRLQAVREELKRLISEIPRPGYKYPGSIYREIAVVSDGTDGIDCGGNTTFVTQRMIPSSCLQDENAVALEGHKALHFAAYQNQAEMTPASPFMAWLSDALNERYQEQRESRLFGSDFK